MRVAMLASECEPWAKTGGLADVVDALARALGELDGTEVETPVDVFLPRYRGVPEPASIERTLELRVPDPRAPSGISTVTVLDVPANGYRLRLVDHPAAFDRDGFYGDDAGDYPDNAWRFGLFCRTALEALRADGRPLDILHLHDWHTGAAAIQRDVRYAADPVIGGAAILITLHNLAFHGWTPKEDLRPARPGARGRRGPARRRRDRPVAERDRARGAGQHGLAGFRGRGADAGLRDGPRWRPAGEGRPVPRDPQRTRHDGLGPGDRCGPGRAVFARGSGRQGRLPGGSADPHRVRPGRRRPGDRDDRAARSAEGLRPARRGGADPAQAWGAARRPGQRSPGAGRPVPGDRHGQPRPRWRSSSASTG